jgi:hypothetical protein
MKFTAQVEGWNCGVRSYKELLKTLLKARFYLCLFVFLRVEKKRRKTFLLIYLQNRKKEE